MSSIDLDLSSLERAYASGMTPLQVIDAIYARLEAQPHAGVFISEVAHADARAAAERVLARKAAGETLRLFGVPFAVKDNIDVAGLETTAACPAFAYRATENAAVVDRLIAEGAIVIGKTNLDQFATGLVGVRSPYPIPENPFSAAHVPGGSSSGSAVAVSRGFVSFSLGTDTAGSGRVPAAFNNIVGLKPTRGMLSARGVVPACRSLDCVSVFALSVDDAASIAKLMGGFDAADPYSQPSADRWEPRAGMCPPRFRFAVPAASDLVIDDAPARSLFEAAIAATAAIGGSAVELSLAPFNETAALLYHGPFVAERLEACAALLERDPEAFHPVVREIVTGAKRFSALDAARGYASLSRLRTQCQALLRGVDFLLVPSASLFPRVADVLADPIAINSELGRYTNFVNLLDLCALAIPAGMRSDGLPFGITLIAKAGRDALLASVARVLHPRLANTVGAFGRPLTAAAPIEAPADLPGRARIAVVGAHLSGEPLNHELTDLGARLVASARTAPRYRFYALATTPPKPGLIAADGGGHSIELEVWELDDDAFGQFVKRIPGPLGVGAIELETGTHVQGFLCESVAVAGAPEISQFGGWRAYRRSRA
ncbi:MAG TPA: allophanate hydrolase [Polyangiales bacterium]|nr:allophanate hydrolase [Polyangiales bacterium]